MRKLKVYFEKKSKTYKMIDSDNNDVVEVTNYLNVIKKYKHKCSDSLIVK